MPNRNHHWGAVTVLVPVPEVQLRPDRDHVGSVPPSDDSWIREPSPDAGLMHTSRCMENTNYGDVGREDGW